jgi:hypothetical protein
MLNHPYMSDGYNIIFINFGEKPPKFLELLSRPVLLVVAHKTTLDLLNNFKGQ